MKKTLLVTLCASALAFTTTTAISGETGGGCGVGQMVFEGQTGLAPHIFAGTTNGTFLNSFAITSGTSGCDSSKQVQISDDKKVFVASNADNLKQEIAQGHGEHLTSLATILGVKKADQPSFAFTLQREYEYLYQNDTTSSNDMLAAINDIMLNDKNLAKYAE